MSQEGKMKRSETDSVSGRREARASWNRSLRLLFLLGTVGFAAQPVFSEIHDALEPITTDRHVVGEIGRAGRGTSPSDAVRSLEFARFDFDSADWVKLPENRLLVADSRAHGTGARPYTITFAPNGAAQGAGAITFRDVEGNTREIVVSIDGRIHVD